MKLAASLRRAEGGVILGDMRVTLLVLGALLLGAALPSRAGDCGGYFEGPLGRYELPCPEPIHGPSDRDDRRTAAEPRPERGTVSDADLGGANPNPTTGSPLGQVLWEQRTKGRKKPSQ